MKSFFDPFLFYGCSIVGRVAETVTGVFRVDPTLILPVTERLLAAPCRAGALLVGSHPNFAEEVREVAGRIGRSADLLYLDGSSSWTNPLRNVERDARAVADWLLSFGSGPTVALEAGGLRLLSGACIMAKLDGLGRVEGVSAVSKAVEIFFDISRLKPGRKKEVLDEAVEAISKAEDEKILAVWEQCTLIEYLTTELACGLPSQIDRAVAAVRVVLGRLTEGAQAAMFEPSRTPEFWMEQLFDAGTIAVVSGPVPPLFLAILEHQFRWCRLNRTRCVFFDGMTARMIDPCRPAFLIGSFRRRDPGGCPAMDL